MERSDSRWDIEQLKLFGVCAAAAKLIIEGDDAPNIRRYGAWRPWTVDSRLLTV